MRVRSATFLRFLAALALTTVLTTACTVDAEPTDATKAVRGWVNDPPRDVAFPTLTAEQIGDYRQHGYVVIDTTGLVAQQAINYEQVCRTLASAYPSGRSAYLHVDEPSYARLNPDQLGDSVTIIDRTARSLGDLAVAKIQTISALHDHLSGQLEGNIPLVSVLSSLVFSFSSREKNIDNLREHEDKGTIGCSTNIGGNGLRYYRVPTASEEVEMSKIFNEKRAAIVPTMSNEEYFQVSDRFSEKFSRVVGERKELPPGKTICFRLATYDPAHGRPVGGLFHEGPQVGTTRLGFSTIYLEDTVSCAAH